MLPLKRIKKSKPIKSMAISTKLFNKLRSFPETQEVMMDGIAFYSDPYILEDFAIVHYMDGTLEVWQLDE